MKNQSQDSVLPYRPLGKVKEVLEKLGTDISYAYEDLIFVTHNQYLLQFGEVGEELFYLANREAGDNEQSESIDILAQAFGDKGIELKNGGSYTLEEEDDGNLRVEFFLPQNE